MLCNPKGLTALAFLGTSNYTNVSPPIASYCAYIATATYTICFTYILTPVMPDEIQRFSRTTSHKVVMLPTWPQTSRSPKVLKHTSNSHKARLLGRCRSNTNHASFYNKKPAPKANKKVTRDRPSEAWRKRSVDEPGRGSETAYPTQKRFSNPFEGLQENLKQNQKEKSIHIEKVNQQHVQAYGRWLFSSDRLNLCSLNETEQQTQKTLATIQSNFKATSPGEYLYLCLMRLPREVRDMIWTAYMDGLPQTIVLRLQSRLMTSDLPKVLPPLCYVNHQFFDECVPALLRGRKIILDGAGVVSFGKFLRRVRDNMAFSVVTHVVIESHTKWAADSPSTYASQISDEEHWTRPSSQNIRTGEDLVANLPALKSLTLYIDIYQLELHIEEAESCVSRANEELQKLYPVRAFIDYRSLEHLTLLCDGYHLSRLMEMDEEEMFKPFVTWFGDQLSEKAPKVQFTVVYNQNQDMKEFVGWEEEDDIYDFDNQNIGYERTDDEDFDDFGDSYYLYF
jgi:hypothetical protein